MSRSYVSLCAAVGGLALLTGQALAQSPANAAAGQTGAEVHEHAQAREDARPHEHTDGASGSHGHAHGAVSGMVAADAALSTQPEDPRVGAATTLTFTLTDSAGQPLEALITHHARTLHVVILSEDMRVLGHIHPQDFDESIEAGEAKVHFTFPQAGRYLIAADMLTEDGPYAEQFLVEVAGEESGAAVGAVTPARIAVVEAEGGDRYTAPILLDDANKAAGYELSLARPERIEAGAPATFTLRVTRGGTPVTDLRPFLAAPLHLVVVKEDLSNFLHAHGTIAKADQAGYRPHDHADGHRHASHGYQGPSSFGPELTATLTFPEPGRYYLFGQAAHGENLLVSRFPVEVR